MRGCSRMSFASSSWCSCSCSSFSSSSPTTTIHKSVVRQTSSVTPADMTSPTTRATISSSSESESCTPPPSSPPSMAQPPRQPPTAATAAPSSTRRPSRSDERVLRRLGSALGKCRTLPSASLHPASARRAHNPPPSPFLQAFLDHFPGSRGFFTELALFNQADLSHLKPTQLKSIQRFINGLALMRISSIRPASLCEFCTTVNAPFCAISPDLQPPGCNQHKLATSRRCVLHRAIGGGSTRPDRIRALFANQHNQLRLVLDTDHQAQPMLMLAPYSSRLWNACHQVGLHMVVHCIQLVCDEHGIPLDHKITHPSAVTQQEQQHQQHQHRALVQCFTPLISVSPLQLPAAHTCTVDQAAAATRLAHLHMAIFGADWADLAMQLISVTFTSKEFIPESTASTSEHEPCPPNWLQSEANAIHAVYAPDEYPLHHHNDSARIQVSRNHLDACTLLDQWMQQQRDEEEEEQQQQQQQQQQHRQRPTQVDVSLPHPPQPGLSLDPGCHVVPRVRTQQELRDGEDSGHSHSQLQDEVAADVRFAKRRCIEQEASRRDRSSHGTLDDSHRDLPVQHLHDHLEQEVDAPYMPSVEEHDDIALPDQQSQSHEDATMPTDDDEHGWICNNSNNNNNNDDDDEDEDEDISAIETSAAPEQQPWALDRSFQHTVPDASTKALNRSSTPTTPPPPSTPTATMAREAPEEQESQESDVTDEGEVDDWHQVRDAGETAMDEQDGHGLQRDLPALSNDNKRLYLQYGPQPARLPEIESLRLAFLLWVTLIVFCLSLYVLYNHLTRTACQEQDSQEEQKRRAQLAQAFVGRRDLYRDST